MADATQPSAASATGAAPQGGVEKAPAALEETFLAVRVVCSEKHPLTGLFVIWAPILRAAAQNRAGTAPSGSPEAEIVALAEQYDPVAGPFSVGIVDRAGYLQPARPGRNPWRDVLTDSKPHTYKLVEGTYRFCLLRHPSPALAFAVQSYLNSPDGTFDAERWGGPQAWDGADRTTLVEEMPLKKETLQPPPDAKPGTQAGDELRLELAEAVSNERFWPRGHDIYQGWTLYRNMPHGSCEPVVAQVKSLQVHLGALRYPIGVQNRPYFPEKRTKDLERGNLGELEGRTAAALASFQEHAKNGVAFQVADDGANQHAKLVDPDSETLRPKVKADDPKTYVATETWSYLLPKDPEHPEVAKIEKDARLSTYVPGLMDWRTAEAMKAWFKHRYRKPGPILLKVDGLGGSPVYMREEAAVQLEAWRKLVEIVGCSYGLPSAHSFREVDYIVRGEPGMLNNSIHKTGFAIDLAIRGYVRPIDDWPIRIEQRHEPRASDPLFKDQARLADAKAQHSTAEGQLRADAAKAGVKPEDAAKGVPTASTPEAGATPESARRASTLALGTADAARKAALKGKGPWAAVVDCDVEYISAINREMKVLEQEIKRLSALDSVTKDAYRMHFCLYGHSDLDLFGNFAAAAEALAKKLEKFPEELRASLKARFTPQSDAADAWLNEPLKPFVKLAAELTEQAQRTISDPAGAVSLYFRESLRPFLFDPREKDGGTSLGSDLYPSGHAFFLTKVLHTIDEGTKWSGGRLPAFAGTAKCYVNLTELGRLCGLLAIGTAGTKWKQHGFQTLRPVKGFAEFAKLVREAHDHPDSKDSPVLVARGKGNVKEYPLADVDVDFLEKWNASLEDLALAPAEPSTPAPPKGGSGKPAAPKKRGKSPSFSVTAPQITVLLPTPGQRADADRLLAKLRGDHKSHRFVLLKPGKETGLADRAGTTFPGSALAIEIQKAFDAFKDALDKVKKAQEEQDAAAKQKAGKAAPAKPGKPAPPPPPKPTDLEKLVKRERSWFEVTLQPFLLTKGEPAADLANVPFLPTDDVQVPAPGIPRTLEWWHHQSKAAMGSSWETLMSEIGFSNTLLLAPDTPPADYGRGGDERVDGRGLGYEPSEMSATAPGITSEKPPGNVWIPPPKGW